MAYASLLAGNGYLPNFPTVLGRVWSAACPSETHLNMSHSVQEDAALQAIRFELKNTVNDVSPDGRHRSELSTKEETAQQAHNGVKQWNTYMFKMPKWSNRNAMANALGSTAMSISQYKPNSGGSPTRCHRLTKYAYFRATKTAGSADNVKLYTGNRRLDDGLVHRVVEAVTPHPTKGRWELWLDGTKIVDFTGSIGANTGGYSPSFGIYAASGIGCDVIIEYAGIQILQNNSLESLKNDRTWPS